MRKFFRILGIAVVVVVVLLIGGLIYFNSAFPNTEAPANLKIEKTAERLERGRYLANHVTVCIDCHSTRDWSKMSGPIVPGSEGKGGDKFDESMDFPGTIYAKNITPEGIGRYSDGELVRVITTGVTKENDALFPLMPYLNYNNLSQEDLYSIITYIRSLKPVKNNIPETNLNFPLNYIVKTIPPEKYIPKKSIDKSNTVEYGKYLVTIASCADCHTPAKEGAPLPGMDFAGGGEFKTPGYTIRTANITPDMETGIGKWTKEDFLNRFRNYRNPEIASVKLKQTDFNTIMPWIMYAGMTDEDLGAIYDYLKTVKPVKNNVIRWEMAKK